MSYPVFAAHPRAAQRPVRAVLAVLALAALAACQPRDPGTPAASAANTAPPATASPNAPVTAVPVAYTPPTADALYQMVAPIALYPDKLVALVLAGAIHPDEVTSAYNWLAQNPQAAADGVNQQPWDPSIKALTTFPNALQLMQSNLPWITALGRAYNNDPTDVLNAVQVMRLRAQKAGHLQTNAHLRVTRSAAPVVGNYTPSSAATVFYAGPAVVPPPEEYIAIEPTQVQTVYVPSYDPGVVYGSPVAYYQGYQYRAPLVSGPAAVGVGALAFGAGVAITAALDHPDWGWHSWGVHWGDGPAQARWHRGDAPLPPAARPAVTYQQSTYVSHVRPVTNVTRVDRVDNVVTENHTTVTNNYGVVPPSSGAVSAPSAGLTAPPHHGTAALAGVAVVGGALGAMAVHHGAAAPAPLPAPLPAPQPAPRPALHAATAPAVVLSPSLAPAARADGGARGLRREGLPLQAESPSRPWAAAPVAPAPARASAHVSGGPAAALPPAAMAPQPEHAMGMQPHARPAFTHPSGMGLRPPEGLEQAPHAAAVVAPPPPSVQEVHRAAPAHAPAAPHSPPAVRQASLAPPAAPHPRMPAAPAPSRHAEHRGNERH